MKSLAFLIIREPLTWISWVGKEVHPDLLKYEVVHIDLNSGNLCFSLYQYTVFMDIVFCLHL